VATLGRLAALREDAYAATAHAEVDTDGKAVDEVATAVLDVYAEAEP
jgi:hypothetical protein